MSNQLTHRGYTATINYSAEDNIFYGKLAMINDLVTFEADNVADLKREFIAAVDDYLQTCAKLGKQPDKTFKGVFNVRVSPQLHKKLYTQALKNNTSLNKLIAEKLAL